MNNLFKHFIFFAIAILFRVLSPLNAQEQETVINENNFNGADVFIINKIDFDITGRTMPLAILINTEISAGEQITGFANLEKYILDKTQILNNQRVLESSSIEYEILDAREDGKYPVNLFITAKDTWNIIALPYPKYDSNSGFEFYIKARDYNFFGAMAPLRIDIGYKRDLNERDYFSLMAENDFIFKILSFNSSLRVYNYFEYRPELSEPFYYNGSLGLNVNIPVSFISLSLGISESIFINQEDGGNIQTGPYLSSGPSLSLRIPFPLEIGNYGNIAYTPSVSAQFNHELPDFPLASNRIGPWIYFGHSLGFGRMNWQGNFLDGLSASASNNYTYDFYNDAFSSNISAVIIARKAVEDHFGLSGRFMYRQWFDSITGSAGDALRGIIDSNVSADIMFSANLNLTVRAIKARPDEWFNVPGFKYFNFDFHLSPFFDFAVFRDPALEQALPYADVTYKNFLMSAGLEALVFPLAARSIQLRASLGINMSPLIGMSRYEIYIGTELFY